MTLNWQEIQDKWQKEWAKKQLGKAQIDKNKDKFFMIFAYPGISGFLHVGHMRGFSYTDAICRYERLQGKQVLFPVGTHASGNLAITFANKVKNKDEKWLDYLTKNGCPKEQLKKLEDPQEVINYFNQVYVEDYWKKFGFLCDWERFVCTTNQDYEKFIQWQFQKLRQKELLIQKPYFAPACLKHGPVAVDPSETDISKGGNAEKQEFTLLKFKFGDDYLVAATLRPETIYGQTNLWVNPNSQYVRVEVEGENWILSKEAADKLVHQKDEILLKEDLEINKLIGRTVLAPGIKKEIIILPTTFCDPNVGTGIVTSVPSDAPFDYVALEELKNNKEVLAKYNLDLNYLKPIPIIKSKETTSPAKEIVEKLQITSVDDPKLKEATKETYRAGFHTGVMLNNCGPYSGMKVEEAKELIKVKLLEENLSDLFYDLSEEVVCRCGEKVLIKKIDDQWFIKYSDQELTEKTKSHIKNMQILPKEYAEHLPGILDWFSDRACVRLGNWLGSKFPLDKKWIVEPISDSTLYPAYYIVSKFVNNKELQTKDLTEEFFDYVFLGVGEGKKAWKPIKEEFSYFYPLNMNLGGKEHKTVHFPVFLMNHVAILPEDKWPQGIFVNWWVTGKGSKISKSKGGAEPIPQAINKYGVDAMRLYYAHIGSPDTDVIWQEETVLQYKKALERIYLLVEDLKKLDGKEKLIDSWLASRVHLYLKEIKSLMKDYQLRELASIVYYSLYDDLKWYVRRGGCSKKIINQTLSVWSKLMNPITPHLSEELSEELVSSSLWPKIEESKISLEAEAGEDLVKDTIESMRNVLKLAKLEKGKFTLYISQEWLYELYEVLVREIKVTRNPGEIMRVVLAQEGLKIKGKEVSKIVMQAIKDPSRLPSIITSQKKELQVLQEAKSFLEEEFSSKIEIVSNSDHPKALNARPGKVGILLTS